MVEWDDDGTGKPAASLATAGGNSALPPASDFSAPWLFGGHRYHLFTEELNWDDAKAKAEAMGGHLAVITSKEENEWILKKVSIPPGRSQYDNYHLGGYRDPKNKDSTWKWVTGEPVDMSLWSGKGPDASGSALSVWSTRREWDDIDLKRQCFFLVEWDDDGTGKPAMAASPLALGATSSSAATKDSPFENTLGMKFVPVPITGGPTHGQRVLFSIWDTRVEDYGIFAKDNGQSMSKPGFEQGPTHPAVAINLDEANAFCAWLTEKERKAGRLSNAEEYRLPLDHEWSCGAGIGEKEDASASPGAKNSGLPGVYGWGTQWPPPPKAGNYAGEEVLPLLVTLKINPKDVLPKYNDGYPATSPVGSFPANPFGLFDMGGNVFNWCPDFRDGKSGGRVLRGGGWWNGTPGALQLCYRASFPPQGHDFHVGFRVVLAPVAPSVASSSDPPSLTGTVAAATGSPPKPSAVAPAVAPVPPNPSPPTAPTPSDTRLAQLAALDEQFLKLKGERVTAPFEGEIAKLNTGYVGGIDRAIADEKKAGRLDGIIALEAEKKLIEDKKPMPDTDDAAILPAIKNLRGIYRGAFAKLTATRDANLKALTEPLDKRLAQLEADLIKADRIADAKTVRAYRDTLAKSSPGMQPVKTAAIPEPARPANAAGTPVYQDGYANSLGMKFVHVKDTDVLVCIHETRCKDWAAYAAENPRAGGVWQPRPVDGFTVTERAEDHPVTNTNWEQAHQFCEWLSKKEGKYYRMPTDREWSYAAGVGNNEKWRKDSLPSTITRDPEEFPWGKRWPPPKNAGNFSDESRKAKAPNKDARYLERYDDGFPTTAPVMSFEPNKLGIYDLSGNVWE